jgi:hypothetical protein
MREQSYGSWAFIIGVVLAIIFGLYQVTMNISSAAYEMNIMTLILVIIGLVVGYSNIREKEKINFLIATIALLATNTATQWLILNQIGMNVINIGTIIAGILSFIGVFIAPAAVIVALKAIYDLGYKQK